MRRTLSILLLAVATPALADEVLLRGGGRLSGVVVERTPSRIVIETAPGRVTLPASRVERVVSSSSAIATYETRAESLAPVRDGRGDARRGHPEPRPGALSAPRPRSPGAGPAAVARAVSVDFRLIFA